MSVENNNLNINQQPLDLTSEEKPEVVSARLEEQEAEKRQKELSEGIRRENASAKSDAFVRGSRDEQKITQGDLSGYTKTSPKITDTKNGEQLIKRIIGYTDEMGKIVEIIITYSEGKPIKKTKKENGNTVGTTEYTVKKTKKGEEIVVATTMNPDLTVTEEYAKTIDENGEYTDEDFISKENRSQLTGARTIIKREKGQIKEIQTNHKGEGSLKIYNTDKLSDYEKGGLEPENAYKLSNGKVVAFLVDKKYATMKELEMGMPTQFAKSDLTDKNQQEIFDMFDINGDADGILDSAEIKYLLAFIGKNADIFEDGIITEAELQALSKVLQKNGINNANFKGFIDALREHAKSVQSHTGMMLSSGDIREVIREDSGRVSVNIKYPDGELKKRGFMELPWQDTEIKDWKTYTEGFHAYSLEEDSLGNFVHPLVKETYSPRYQRELETFALTHFEKVNQEVHDIYSQSRQAINPFTLAGDLIATAGTKILTASEGLSAAREDDDAMRDIIKASRTVHQSGNEAVISDGTERIVELDTAIDYDKFNEAYKANFKKDFDYRKAETFKNTATKYEQATALQTEIRTLDEGIKLAKETYKSKISSILTEPEAEELKSYGIEVNYDKKNVGLDKYENRMNKYLLILCRTVGHNSEVINELMGMKDILPHLNDSDWGNILQKTQESLKQSYKEVLGNKQYGDLEGDYRKQYSELYGTSFNNKAVMENMITAGNMVGQLAEMAVVMGVTQGLAGVITSEMASGFEAYKTGKNVSGLADFFKGATARFGQEGSAQITRFMGNMAFPVSDIAIKTLTAGGQEERMMTLEHAPDTALFALFGGYLASPVSKAVGEVVEAKTASKILTQITEISTETTAFALFDAVSQNTELQNVFLSNGQTMISCRLISAVLGARTNRMVENKIKKAMSDIKIEKTVENGKEMYSVKQNGQVVFQSDNPQQILAGVMAMGTEVGLRAELNAELESVQKQRKVEFKDAQKRTFTSEDLADLKGMYGKIEIENGFVCKVEADGRKIPLGKFEGVGVNEGVDVDNGKFGETVEYVGAGNSRSALPSRHSDGSGQATGQAMPDKTSAPTNGVGETGLRAGQIDARLLSPQQRADNVINSWDPFFRERLTVEDVEEFSSPEVYNDVIEILNIRKMDQFDYSKTEHRFGTIEDVRQILELCKKYGKENVMKLLDYSVKDEDGYVWGLRADQLEPVLESKSADFVLRCLDLKKAETDETKQQFYTLDNLRKWGNHFSKNKNKDIVTNFILNEVLPDKNIQGKSIDTILWSIKENSTLDDMRTVKQMVLDKVYDDMTISDIMIVINSMPEDSKAVLNGLVSSNPDFIRENIMNIRKIFDGGVNVIEKASQKLKENPNSTIEDCITETVNHYKALEKDGKNPVTPRRHVDKNDSYYHRMFGLYAGMTTKSGKLVFQGKGDKTFDIVVDYMASLPEVSKEATAMRMLTEMVQDELVGTHVLEYLPREGEVNPLIMKEIQRFYDAYINNIPFDEVLCPTVEVKNSANIEAGEVFEVKGEQKVYIKNEDGTSTQLDMDKATYCKLFPPIERVASTQNEIGNCWQITGFNGLLRDPVERQNVLRCFHQDGKNITIKFPNGVTNGIEFQNGELPKGADPKLYSKGALGLNLLEISQAIEMQREMLDKKTEQLNNTIKNAKSDYEREVAQRELDDLNYMLKTNPNDIYFEKSMYSDDIEIKEGKGEFDYGFTQYRDGGQISNVWKLMGYENPRQITINDSNRYQILEMLSDPNFFKDNLVGIGSEVSFFGTEKDIDAGRGLVSKHAYWLMANADESGNIESYNTLNPWGITEGTFNRHEIFQHSEHLYVAGRRGANNKDALSNGKLSDGAEGAVKAETSARENSRQQDNIRSEKSTKSPEITQAEADLKSVAKSMSEADIAEIVQACKLSDGTVSEELISIAKKYTEKGVAPKNILLLLKSKRKSIEAERIVPTQENQTVTEYVANQTETPVSDPSAGTTKMTPKEVFDYLKGLNRFSEAEVLQLSNMYAEVENTLLDMVNKTKPNSNEPQYSFVDISNILKGDYFDFNIKMLDAKIRKPDGSHTDKLTTSQILDIVNSIPDKNNNGEKNTFKATILNYIKENLAYDDAFGYEDIKTFIKSLDSEAEVGDFDVISEIIRNKNISESDKSILTEAYNKSGTQQLNQIRTALKTNPGIGIDNIIMNVKGDIVKKAQQLKTTIDSDPQLTNLPEDIKIEVSNLPKQKADSFISNLKTYLEKHPETSDSKKANILKLFMNYDKQGDNIDIKSMMENDLYDSALNLLDFVEKSDIQKGLKESDINTNQVDILSTMNFNVTKEVFDRNKQYITDNNITDKSKIIDIMKRNIDFQSRRAELAKSGKDPEVCSVLQRVENISDIDGIEQLINKIRGITDEIENPALVADVLNKAGIDDYADFNKYIEGVNISELMKTATSMSKFEDRDWTAFFAYHYQNNTREFTPEKLAFDRDFTKFLADNYVSADNMKDLFAAFPNIDRNVGELPPSWFDGIEAHNNPENIENIRYLLSTFATSAKPSIGMLQTSLWKMLGGKTVDVKWLEKDGEFKRGYRIVVGDSEPVFLGVFKQSTKFEHPLHGRDIEVQTGLFLNGRMDSQGRPFVHSYGGRIGEYTLTQFMTPETTPDLAIRGNQDYVIESKDVSRRHNVVGEQDVIIDHGNTVVTKADGSDASFKLFGGVNKGVNKEVNEGQSGTRRPFKLDFGEGPVDNSIQLRDELTDNFGFTEQQLNGLSEIELTQVKEVMKTLSERVDKYNKAVENKDIDFSSLINDIIYDRYAGRRIYSDTSEQHALQILMTNPKYKEFAAKFGGKDYLEPGSYDNSETPSEAVVQKLGEEGKFQLVIDTESDKNQQISDLKSEFDENLLNSLSDETLACLHNMADRINRANDAHNTELDGHSFDISVMLELAEPKIRSVIETKINTDPNYAKFDTSKNGELVADTKSSNQSWKPTEVIDNTDPFELKGKFTKEQMSQTGIDLLNKTGRKNKKGKDIYETTPEADKIIFELAEQIRAVSLENEPEIVRFMRKIRLNSKKSAIKDKNGNPIDLSHRSKSIQSLHDKILNELLDNPEITLNQAVDAVRDGVGVRTANEILKDYSECDGVKEALDRGDRATALERAIEYESAETFDALMKYLDTVKAGTNEVEITRISNYMGKNGIPYFTENQIHRLKARAKELGIDLPIIERVKSVAEKEIAKQYEAETGKELKPNTQFRGAGYTGLQINFRVKKTGFVYEWQSRGALVNKFAEREHVPYDLRTAKDIIGKNTELKGLYEPMKEILDEGKMDKTAYTEYENYLCAHYEYLRLIELGFEDGSNPPKFPAGMNPRLRVENLDLLHDYADKIKDRASLIREKGKSEGKTDTQIEAEVQTAVEPLIKEYQTKLVQNTPENTTTESYTAKAKARENSRTISQYEATTRLGGNLKNANMTEINAIVEVCSADGKAISEKLIAKAEQLRYEGVEKDEIIRQINELKQETGMLDISAQDSRSALPSRHHGEDVGQAVPDDGEVNIESFGKMGSDGVRRFSQSDIQQMKSTGAKISVMPDNTVIKTDPNGRTEAIGKLERKNT